MRLRLRGFARLSLASGRGGRIGYRVLRRQARRERTMAEYKDLDRKVIRLSKQTVRMCTAAGSGRSIPPDRRDHFAAAGDYRFGRISCTALRVQWRHGQDLVRADPAAGV